MSAINYYSVYKPFIEDFVALKRHLGYKYINIEYPLMQFDQLAYDREETTGDSDERDHNIPAQA